MARFSTVIGFSIQQKTAPGVTENVITEKQFSGSVIRTAVKQQEGENLHKDLSLDISFSFVADPWVINNLFAMKYIKWRGALWTISNIDESQRPRLILRPGGVYNGPTPVVP